MSIQEGREPIYERNVKEILNALEAGKTREEVAEMMGYSNFKSLGNYMRRKNFSWDGRQSKFIPSIVKETPGEEYIVEHSKAGKIINMFADGSLDAKAIAEKVGFKSHRDIGEYMESKGFRWDSEQGNYVKALYEENSESQAKATEYNRDISPGDLSELASYMPLLKFLKENEGTLTELLNISSKPVQMPRYAIPGIPTTKSVHMMTTLDKLAKDFSKEKNISQRDLFEAALIEFLQKYGFKKEVEHLLNSK